MLSARSKPRRLLGAYGIPVVRDADRRDARRGGGDRRDDARTAHRRAWSRSCPTTSPTSPTSAASGSGSRPRAQVRGGRGRDARAHRPQPPAGAHRRLHRAADDPAPARTRADRRHDRRRDLRADDDVRRRWHRRRGAARHCPGAAAARSASRPRSDAPDPHPPAARKAIATGRRPTSTPSHWRWSSSARWSSLIRKSANSTSIRCSPTKTASSLSTPGCAIAGPEASRRAGRCRSGPIPSAWERRIAIRGVGDLLLRPIKPEDEHLYAGSDQAADARRSADAVLHRQPGPRRTSCIARLTQIDYAREMAFVAIDETNGESARRVAADRRSGFREAPNTR